MKKKYVIRIKSALNILIYVNDILLEIEYFINFIHFHQISK